MSILKVPFLVVVTARLGLGTCLPGSPWGEEAGVGQEERGPLHRNSSSRWPGARLVCRQPLVWVGQTPRGTATEDPAPRHQPRNVLALCTSSQTQSRMYLIFLSFILAPSVSWFEKSQKANSPWCEAGIHASVGSSPHLLDFTKCSSF